MSSTISRIDAAIYRVERAAVVALLVVMSAVVFLDVVHRTAADPSGFLVRWVGRLRGTPGAADAVTRGLATVLSVLGWSVVLAFAVYGRGRGRVPAKRCAGAGVLLALVGYGLVRAVVALFPNGFIWSQPFALILLLWVGFLGASMCTYEDKHLRVEAVERYLPERARRPVAVVRHLVTAGFLAFLVAASWNYVVFHFEEWQATEHRGGLFLGTIVPRWVGFAVLPVAFSVMALRFLGRAVRALRGDLSSRDAVADLVAGRRRAHVPEVAP